MSHGLKANINMGLLIEDFMEKKIRGFFTKSYLSEFVLKKNFNNFEIVFFFFFFLGFEANLKMFLLQLFWGFYYSIFLLALFCLDYIVVKLLVDNGW